MPRCDYCDDEFHSPPFLCQQCGGSHCVDCRFPNQHACGQETPSSNRSETKREDSKPITSGVASPFGDRDDEDLQLVPRFTRRRLALLLAVAIVGVVLVSQLGITAVPVGSGESDSFLERGVEIAAGAITAIDDGVTDSDDRPPNASDDSTEENVPIGLTTDSEEALVDDERETAGINVTKIERLIEQKVNEERAERNLPHLRTAPQLVAVARNHSNDMNERNYVSHHTPDGESPQDRIEAADIDCMVGENLAQSWFERPVRQDGETVTLYTEEAVARNLVRRWMDSSGHRANIVNEAYDYHGVGVVVTEDGKIFATHKFCTVP